MSAIAFTTGPEAARWVLEGVTTEPPRESVVLAYAPHSILALVEGAPGFGAAFIPHDDATRQAYARADASRRFRKADVMPRCFRFAFDDLGAERLVSAVLAHNTASRRLTTNLGFRETGWKGRGVQRRHYYEMNRDECFWIKEC